MAGERHHVSLETYMGDVGLESTRQLAEHFDIGQTTAVRWMKNENLWVVVDDDGWLEVYTERTLKERGE